MCSPHLKNEDVRHALRLLLALGDVVVVFYCVLLFLRAGEVLEREDRTHPYPAGV